MLFWYNFDGRDVEMTGEDGILKLSRSKTK